MEHNEERHILMQLGWLFKKMGLKCRQMGQSGSAYQDGEIS